MHKTIDSKDDSNPGWKKADSKSNFLVNDSREVAEKLPSSIVLIVRPSLALETLDRQQAMESHVGIHKPLPTRLVER